MSGVLLALGAGGGDRAETGATSLQSHPFDRREGNACCSPRMRTVYVNGPSK